MTSTIHIGADKFVAIFSINKMMLSEISAF